MSGPGGPRVASLQVLTCTFNRRGLLERTIASLNRAERPGGCAVSLFVVANACTDDTAEFLDAYREAAPATGQLPLEWIAESVPGKARALNRAAGALAGDVIAFVDDDHRVDAGYLRAVVEGARAYPEASLFCGRILPDWDGSEPAWVHDAGPHRIYPLPIPRYEQGDAPRRIGPEGPRPGGGNLAVRREVLRQVGEFRTDFGPVGHDLGGAEDLEWVGRAVESGLGLQYLPAMLQYHYVDPERLTLAYLMRKAFERSSSMIRLSEPEEGEGALPLYTLRKTAVYALSALTRLDAAARRAYLVRLAAALGEMKGFVRRWRDHRNGRARAPRKAS